MNNRPYRAWLLEVCAGEESLIGEDNQENNHSNLLMRHLGIHHQKEILEQDAGEMLTRATLMRVCPTVAEAHLMFVFDKCKIPYIFQGIGDGYIIDFILADIGVAIELDGALHDTVEDAARDCQIKEQFEFDVWRYPNTKALYYPREIVERILCRYAEVRGL